MSEKQKNLTLSGSNLAIQYIVLKALDKDKVAMDLLDAVGLVWFDDENNQIYPPLPKDNGNGGQA